MRLRPSGIFVIALLVATCVPSAHAQGGGETRTTVVVQGQTATRELKITLDNGDLGEGENGIVVLLSNGGAIEMLSFNANSLPFGAELGPMGAALLGSLGPNSPLSIVDPGVSYIHQLIKRHDVRSDLFLNSKQREQLDQLDAQEHQAAQLNGNVLVTSPNAGPAATVGSSGSNAAANVQQEITSRSMKLSEPAKQSPDEQDRKLAAILTPRQIQRLKELDLQYRGALALGVKPVAEKATLKADQEPVAADLLKAYHEVVKKALGIEQTTHRSTEADGSVSVSINSSSTLSSPDEMRSRLERAHDEIENARRKLADKLLKGLADSQRAEWKAMTGVRFQFLSLE